MTHQVKDNVQVITAVIVLLGGFSLAVAGFVTPPQGQIHESVLTILAECMIYSGSIFGVTIYFNRRLTDLKTYINNTVKNEENK